MISVEEALFIIEQNVVPLSVVEIPLSEAAGKALAEAIFSPYDIPAFPQSSMDGYAFAFDDWKMGEPLPVEGEVAAGSGEKRNLPAGKAVRIFTGAPVPAGADTVVMQEKTRVQDGRIMIEDDLLEKGNNVRPAGSEIRKTELAVSPGHPLSPGSIAFLAGMGIARVKVYAAPRISIIVTGNELQKPGEPLAYGQVYESNSLSLGAALKQADIHDIKCFHAADDVNELTRQLALAMEGADLVLLTGGVSVGEYDFVLEAAENLGISTLFYKIRQRPGKPLFFGKKDQCLVLGLPGNPASVLTCFYEYVLPALSLMTQRDLWLKKVQAPLLRSFSKSARLRFFLQAQYDGPGMGVAIVPGQASYKMSGFAIANCLVMISEDTDQLEAGQLVEVHLLPA